MSKTRIELFQDRADEYRWRIVAKNGEIIGASTEGFTTSAKRNKNLRQVSESLYDVYWRDYPRPGLTENGIYDFLPVVNIGKESDHD